MGYIKKKILKKKRNFLKSEINSHILERMGFTLKIFVFLYGMSSDS